VATRLSPPPGEGRPPAFWTRARAHLRKADPAMAAIIDAHPKVRLVSRGDAFSTLARSIVGQQISVKAADSVWARLLARCEPLSPQSVLRRRVPTLRACGLSERKAEYLRDLSVHFRDFRVTPEGLAALGDEEVIDALTEIRGIGRWTAEMFLIFNLMRPDILPLDDLGLLKAVGRHYFDGEAASALLRGEGRARVAAVAERWAPYRSVATWYLWRSLDPVPVEY
jgi:DNA-3-methyladenine glycosylase II